MSHVEPFSPSPDQDDVLWLLTGNIFDSYSKLWCLSETKGSGGGWGEDGGDYSLWSVAEVEGYYGLSVLSWLPLDPADRGGEAVTILAFWTRDGLLRAFALSRGRRAEGGAAAAAGAGAAGQRAREVLEKKNFLPWSVGDELCLTPEGVLVRPGKSKRFEFHPYNW